MELIKLKSGYWKFRENVKFFSKFKRNSYSARIRWIEIFVLYLMGKIALKLWQNRFQRPQKHIKSVAQNFIVYRTLKNDT